MKALVIRDDDLFSRQRERSICASGRFNAEFHTLSHRLMSDRERSNNQDSPIGFLCDVLRPGELNQGFPKTAISKDRPAAFFYSPFDQSFLKFERRIRDERWLESKPPAQLRFVGEELLVVAGMVGGFHGELLRMFWM